MHGLHDEWIPKVNEYDGVGCDDYWLLVPNQPEVTHNVFPMTSKGIKMSPEVNLGSRFMQLM